MPRKSPEKSPEKSPRRSPEKSPAPEERPTEPSPEGVPAGSTVRPVDACGAGVDKPRRGPLLDGDPADNVVELRGRVSSAPVERHLPSGAAIATFRISVARARTPMTGGSRQSADWVDCTAWSARSRRSVAAWTVGDVVEVTGALRRRFFRIGTGASTRIEVEVLHARRPRPR